MSMSRSVLIAAALAVLLVTTVVVPAAAAKTKLAIVNGIPGKTVDVCVNGVEVKSGLRYGRKFFKNTRTAKATVKFYKRDPRRCGGKLLAKKTSGLDDATWVITRRHPLKIVVFDNSYLAGPMSADTSRGTWRHAADLGAVSATYAIDFVTWNPIVLGEDDSTKGGQVLVEGKVDEIWSIRFQKGDPPVNVVRPYAQYMEPLRRWEWILVGTAISNAKLVRIDRPGASL